MKEIIINSKKYGQKVALVDDSDFYWLNQWKWSLHKDKNTYYAHRMVWLKASKKNKEIKMHRLILGLTSFETKTDHIDHNGLNNQRYNLRVATNAQNLANISPRKNVTSKYLGVSWRKESNKWVCQITKNGKKKYLGLFDNQEQAALAYNDAAKILHAEFANLNKIAS